jgi:integrase
MTAPPNSLEKGSSAMATYKIRGSTHNVIYTYRTASGAYKQQWESYETELEAIQRKAYIDHLQKGKRQDEIQQAVSDYKRKRAIERSAREAAQKVSQFPPVSVPQGNEDNTHQTFQEFISKFLPFYARKKRFSPNTYDSYESILANHVLPYFGHRVMSSITSEDIDDFLDYLSQKPCQGSKSYGKKIADIPKLSSATIKKCYNVLTVGFPTAKKWRYITEIPETTAPSEKTKKRRAWEPQYVFQILDGCKDDPVLHLAIHIAFVCSLREGEVAGIDISTIDLYDRSLWISQIVQRVSDKALEVLPKEEIIKVFPKKVSTSKSSLILKSPKTDGSQRKQYLTTPLLQEIKTQMDEINTNKELLGKEYHDNGLLICRPDGSPIEPKSLDKAFKDRQAALNIEPQIDFQGLRKSGQMHKIRLCNNNYQLVAENAGQSPQVLMSNYNEALDSEKRTLTMMVETSFYPGAALPDASVPTKPEDAQSLLEKIQQDPALSKQLLQLLLSNALN